GVIATVLSALTVITEALPVASRVTVFCGIKIALGSTPVITVARTNIPGRSKPSGFGNSARKVTLPVLSSTLTSVNFIVPLCS
ncbi:hypothetical protein D049_3388B, partial [Vibrio parahaemolyticus VPTS-2010]